MLPFSRKKLEEWAGPHVFKDALRVVEAGRVLDVHYEQGHIHGTIQAMPRPIKSELFVYGTGELPDNECPCRDSRERGVMCVHSIALCIELLRIDQNPERKAKLEEERRRAERLAGVQESEYVRRVPRGSPRAIPMEVVIVFDAGWEKGLSKDRVPMRCLARLPEGDFPMHTLRKDVAYAVSQQDDNILYVVEDIVNGPAAGSFMVSKRDMLNLLDLLPGRELPGPGDVTYTVNASAMTPYLLLDLDRENGELLLILETELPFRRPADFPLYIVAGTRGWAFASGHFWPLSTVLPLPLQDIYREPMVIPRAAVPHFMRVELENLRRLAPIQTDLAPELFTMEPATPRFKLLVRGSPVSLACTVTCHYGDIELIAGRDGPESNFAIPDPSDLMAYRVRNISAEIEGLVALRQIGIGASFGDDISPMIGKRHVLTFLGSGIPMLRRMGWEVELQGRVTELQQDCPVIVPAVNVIIDPDQGGVFEVNFEYSVSQGESLSLADVQLALVKGESFVEHKGRTVLFDRMALESMQQVFHDCESRGGARPGAFRMDGVFAGYVHSALQQLEGVEVKATPEWLKNCEVQNREISPEPVILSEPLKSTLRPYQQQGVDWLRYLETAGFSGILADEMGLGKTLQTLCWLQLERHRPAAREKPILIVCPTSLVENWIEEGARFTPHLRFVNLTGVGREDRLTQWEGGMVGVTSYAILRRDLDFYQTHEIAIIVLDEAQHIKNRSTQNAKAVKSLQAHHRLVLSGTPIENSVSDLWSIMDFLMPGYLGTHDHFRRNYELPIINGSGAHEAQDRLRKKLNPFLMRRLKKDVAKDLPPKIEKLAMCTLTRDQQLVYEQMLKSSQSKIAEMVDAQGFNRSRMEILKTLLRLRQICCHLDLIKLKDLRSQAPSAKLDLFHEMISEAVDGGHRVLVFSQFTSMLKILRTELEKVGHRYCYLDGATLNRMDEVRRFNSSRDIPVFLISLKAGGTGLNLTGADMVIHFDPWWNPAVENQATDRAYRIGQKRTVYSVKMITKNTVEERVLAMQRKKQAMIDAVVGENQFMESLTWDDVQDLLQM